MPTSNSLLLPLFLLFLATVQAHAQDDAPTALDLLLQQHEKTVAELEAKKLAKVNDLNPKYEEALDRIKKKHQADNDFDAILAVAHEIKNYASIPGPDDPPAPGKPSPALLKAKQTYQKSIAGYQSEFDSAFISEIEDSIKKIRSLAAKLATADKLDEAVIADRTRKDLEESVDYQMAIARSKAGIPEDPSPGGRTSVGLPRQGLFAYYPLDGNLKNGQPNGADLKLEGKKDFTSGHIGRAVSIDNGYGKEKNYIDFPLPDGGKSSFSISFCLQAHMDAHRTGVLLGIGTGKDYDTYRFEYQRKGEDKVALYAYRDGSSSESQSGGAPRPEPEWRHIVITVEAKEINHYIDGNLMFSLKPRKPYELVDASGHIPMAYYKRRTDNGDRELAMETNMDCLIDDLAIYDRVLRTNEIKDIAKFYRLGQ